MKRDPLGRQEVGAIGEQMAMNYLVQRGYLILERNWRRGRSEIDLVARDAEVYVMVEVRTRRSQNFGSAEESISSTKKERLRIAGMTFLQENELEDADWRIDVIAIDLDSNGQLRRIEHYIDAVEGGD